ncbi:MAG: hypothetical protein FJY56_02510 [Betaproteobacteria bacterium]|nr:hypothetical protein [Betaproteobacteria bacterium]
MDGKHPPLRVVRGSPWSAQTRYFDAEQAGFAAKSMHALVASSGYLPPGLDLGPAAEPAAVERVLRHVMAQWANETPPRAAERHKNALAMQAVHGFQAVLQVFTAAHAEDLDFSGAVVGDAWFTDDVSRNGYGILVPAGKAERLAVGDLVALRAGPGVPWELGVIRRLSAQAQARCHIGVGLLSAAALPLQVRTMSGAALGGKRSAAILLSEQPTPDGSVYIVARRELLTMREAIEAAYGRESKTLMLEPVGVVESGADFDHLHYRLQRPAF